MIADVVGYGRLSQADEEGTRTRFGALLQAIFEPKIAEHHGRLVKTMGDGLLVEFPSVVNALRCAVDVQRAIAEHNLGQPAGQKLEFRIGINLGDVIVENGDIHGDGVNIAARLQTLAAPGGIVISGAAYDQVKNRLEIGYENLGERRVKNVLEPVRVYSVLTEINRSRPLPQAWRRQWPALAAIAIILLAAGLFGWQRINGPPASLPAAASRTIAELKPSLVVLPFDNLSDDKQQGYLADGITEDLTTELARVPGLFVISRNGCLQLSWQKSRALEDHRGAWCQIPPRGLDQAQWRRCQNQCAADRWQDRRPSLGQSFRRELEPGVLAAGQGLGPDRFGAQAAADLRPEDRRDPGRHQCSCCL
jgi:adenylate cyclase